MEGTAWAHKPVITSLQAHEYIDYDRLNSLLLHYMRNTPVVSNNDNNYMTFTLTIIPKVRIVMTTTFSSNIWHSLEHDVPKCARYKAKHMNLRST